MVKLAYLFACCCRESKDTEEPPIVTLEQRQLTQRNPSLDYTVIVSGVVFCLSDSSLKTQISPEREVVRAPLLLLEFIDGYLQDIGTLIKVSPYGLIKSVQTKPDLSQRSAPKSLSKTLEEAKTQRIDLKFHPPSSSYYIRENSSESSSYFRVDGNYSLTSKQKVAFCESLVTVEIAQSNLILTFIKGPRLGLSVQFTTVQSPILIGRLPTCHIPIEDDSMSRIQCKITYEPSYRCWMLQDGDGKKRSLNGTWILIEEFCEVYHTMVLKTSSAIILARIEPAA
mmetsp:Transcript_7407/g.13815  ORF Transcript_7407/g.13815 Transcript_7407/m.13815 type:complete len:283 (+) Transcript_7407:1126-1974(+)